MLLNILKQINWVDIFILIIVARICYVSVKTGFPIELFKLIGTLAAIYLSLHYYLALSNIIKNWLNLGDRLPFEFLQFVVFFILALSGYCFFVLLRSIFYRFLKMEAVSTLNKWGGLILGAARAIFLASLITFMMIISSIGYFNNSVKASYLGKMVFAVSPNTYTWMWDAIISKFATGENYNKAITSINEDFQK